jgi:hypothetical protein
MLLLYGVVADATIGRLQPVVQAELQGGSLQRAVFSDALLFWWCCEYHDMFAKTVLLLSSATQGMATMSQAMTNKTIPKGPHS